MTLKASHWQLMALFVCAVAISSGCRKADATAQSGSPADVKHEIYKYLAKKSGQKEFAPAINVNLPKQVAVLRSNATVLEQRTAALRTSLRAADEDPAELKKEIEALRGNIAQAKQNAGDARTRLQEVQARTPADANEIAARQKEHADADAAWSAKRQQLTVKEAQLATERAARKQQRTTLQQEFQESERAWETARVEAARKQQELSNQEDNYIRSVREKISGVRSYETLYQTVGQQLATADALLADSDRSRQRMGLKLAREACGHVNSGGVDVWLAARICEAYFWPNLDLADAQPDSRERALDLLETCRRVFFDTYETNNVLKNYELLKANAPNPRAADTYRVQVADWLEEKGSVKHAAEILNEIRDAEVLTSAQERITRVKESVAANP